LNGNTVNMFIAYQESPNQINIADVTINNTTGATIHDTAGLTTAQLQVHDLAHIASTPLVGVANLAAANFDFHAG